MKKNESGVSQEPATRGTDESRRDFLRKAGKLAVYTPPAMMLLMKPSTDAIASSPGAPSCQDFNAAISDCNPKID